METKICNMCSNDKPIVEFRVNSRRCKACQYDINKEYSKTYYGYHKDRILKCMNDKYQQKDKLIKKTNTKIKDENKVLKRRGRPRNPAYYPNDVCA